MANRFQAQNPSPRKSLTAERLREILSYDPETGRMTRLQRTGSRGPAGPINNKPNGDGYFVVRVEGQIYMLHRLAWLYMTGEWPEEQVDHRNRDRQDNRWSNLRSATRAENSRNCARRNTSTGLKGVTYASRYRVWQAQIRVNGKNIYLGQFKSPMEAHMAYRRAALRLHGGFASLD